MSDGVEIEPGDEGAARPEGRTPKAVWKEVVSGSLKTFIGVVLALWVNSCHDSWKDQKTYENTLKSIQFEAEGNVKIIGQTFDPAKFGVRPVFRDLNTKIVESSLSNNTFVERADSELIGVLVEYMNELKRLNAHRGGLEKLYFASDSNSPTNISRREYLIQILATNEIPSCLGKTTNIIARIRGG